MGFFTPLFVFMKKVSIDIVPGFGDDYIDNFQNKLEGNFPPTDDYVFEFRKIVSLPVKWARWEPEKTVDWLVEELEKTSIDANERRILIGDSYGGLLLLAAVLRKKLKQVLKVILIDAPLRSDVAIKGVAPYNKVYAKHYQYRQQLALQCEKLFQEEDASKFIAIGSVNDDEFVTPDAKFPVQNFQSFIIQEKSQLCDLLQSDEASGMAFNKGLNFRLNYSSGHNIDDRLDEITALVQWSLQNIMQNKSYRIGIL